MAQTGREPSGKLSVRIQKNGSRFVAQVALGERKRELDSHDCEELVQSLATIAAVAIDPTGSARKPEPTTVPAEPVVTVPVPPPAAYVPHFRFAGGLNLNVGVGPGPMVGFAVEVGLGWRYVSLNAEGNVVLPSNTQGTPSVSSMVMYGALSPCAHVSWFVGCVRVGLGGLRGEGVGVATPVQQTTLYVLVGARAGVEIQVYEILYIRPVLDLLVPLTRTTLTLDGQAKWTTPPVAGVLTLQALVRLE